MFCIEYGKEIPDGVKFCHDCGASQIGKSVEEKIASKSKRPRWDKFKDSKKKSEEIDIDDLIPADSNKSDELKDSVPKKINPQTIRSTEHQSFGKMGAPAKAKTGGGVHTRFDKITNPPTTSRVSPPKPNKPLTDKEKDTIYAYLIIGFFAISIFYI